MKQVLLPLIILLASASSDCFAVRFDITRFGAKPDGKTLSTRAIQKTIDSCSNAGGGEVYFPAGIFVTGNLVLRSHVNLYFESGSVLRGTHLLDAYMLDGIKRGIFYGENLVDVTISGNGTIDGNARAFHDSTRMHAYIDFDKQYLRQGQAFFDALKPQDGPIFFTSRPDMVLVIMHSEKVRVSGVEFIDAPGWTIRMGDCDGVSIEHVRIKNNILVPNSDGIHCTNSSNVRISHCYIEAGDDALVVSGFGDDINIDNAAYGKAKRTYQYGNKTGRSEDVMVDNCVLISNSSGIRVGYGTGDMHNLKFSNIRIRNSNRGILINTREKGSVSQVGFDNISIETKHKGGSWWGRGEPIHVSAVPLVKDSAYGTIRHVYFNNVIISSETGLVIWANMPGKVEHIYFSDVRMEVKNGEKVELFGGNIDLRPTAQLSTNLFRRDLPAILCYQVNNLFFKNCRAAFNADVPSFYTYVLELERCRNVQVRSCEFLPAPHVNEAVRNQGSEQVVIVANDSKD